MLAYFLTSGWLAMEIAAAAAGARMRLMYADRPRLPECCASRPRAEIGLQYAMANWVFSCRAPFKCENRVSVLNTPQNWTYTQKHHGKKAWLSKKSGAEQSSEVFTVDVTLGGDGSLERTVILDYLRSYEGMSAFTVACTTTCSNEIDAPAVALDGLWTQHMTVADEATVCTTKCAQIRLIVAPTLSTNTTAEHLARSHSKKDGTVDGHRIILFAISSRTSIGAGRNRVEPLDPNAAEEPLVFQHDGMHCVV
jgi:hypothetical protein